MAMDISLITTDIRSEHDVMHTRQRARHIAELLGFEPQDQTRISTAVSEVARNAVQYAGGGKVEFQLTNGGAQTLQIQVKDHGPGIPDLEFLLNESGYVTPKGHTLRGVRRLMDAFHILTSPGKGTIVTLGKVRPRRLPPIERKEIGSFVNALMQRVAEDPLAEMRRQNQELLQTLDELKVQEEARIEHLLEIETLNVRLRRSIRATHHRVKNNLQVISALVELQTEVDDTTVPIEAMTRIAHHIRALAAIHDILTEETKTDAETEAISATTTMEKLIPLLRATAGGRAIHYSVSDFMMPIREGASLAMLVSEIVSNAIKHGRNDIEVTLLAEGDQATLEICDDGAGFPENFDWVKAANTGLGLIDSIGRHDLRGEIAYQNRPTGGGQVIVRFPIGSYFTTEHGGEP